MGSLTIQPLPSGASTVSFTDLQYAFTHHIRDPGHAPAPEGIEDRRMAIYRDLLYRNVETFMANSFPVLRRILDESAWHDLIRDYFRTHQARTPLFPKMPTEFLQYLENGRREQAGDFPFLYELAHYEWVELALAMDKRDINVTDVELQGDLLEGIPVLSELAWPLVYRFPVHRIRPEYLPVTPPPQATCIVVYRDRHDDVGFIELNPVSARLIQLLQSASGLSGRALLLQIASELQHPDPEVVVRGGEEILQMLHARDIIPGTHKA